MLLKFVKWVVIPVGSFVCGLAFKFVMLAIGPKRMKRLALDFFADPEIQEKMKKVGIWDALSAPLSALRRADPEAREWMEWIQNYPDHPDPEEVTQYFRFLEESHLLDDAAMELPTAGSVLAFAQRHPEFTPEWQEEFAELLQQSAGVMVMADPDRPGWNDFYMAQWFILRSDEIVRELVRRSQLDGQVGGTCTWMLNSVSGQYPTLAEALDRCGWKKPPEGVDIRLVGDIPGMTPEQVIALAHDRGMTPAVNGQRIFPPVPGPMTPRDYAQRAIIADCGPYKILSQTPPNEHSTAWVFDITGPGFPPAGIAVVGMDETCGRSIIGGLATAWRAGRIEGRNEAVAAQGVSCPTP